MDMIKSCPLKVLVANHTQERLLTTQKELEDCKQQNIILNNELEVVRSEANARQQKVKELEAQLREYKHELEFFKSDAIQRDNICRDNNRLHGQLAILRERLVKTEEALDRLSKSSKEEIESLQGRLEFMKAAAEHDINNLKHANDELEISVQYLSTAKEELNERLKSGTVELEQYRRKFNDAQISYQDRLRALEEENAALTKVKTIFETLLNRDGDQTIANHNQNHPDSDTPGH